MPIQPKCFMMTAALTLVLLASAHAQSPLDKGKVAVEAKTYTLYKFDNGTIARKWHNGLITIKKPNGTEVSVYPGKSDVPTLARYLEQDVVSPVDRLGEGTVASQADGFTLYRLPGDVEAKLWTNEQYYGRVDIKEPDGVTVTGYPLDAVGPLRLHRAVQWLAIDHNGPFIPLDDGRLLTFHNGEAVFSDDGGRTWPQRVTMYDGQGPGRPSKALIGMRTRDGAIIAVYMDMENFVWSSDKQSLDVWAIRSLDDGKTWIDRQRIFEGYCGALNDIIQTTDGQVVVPVQAFLPEPQRRRHGQYTMVSADDGKTWRRSNLIDYEGAGSGDHAGTFESTLTQLNDGRLWIVLRTTEALGQFWEAFSSDNGLTWDNLQASGIDASSSPAYVCRLASGRLVMTWNRLLTQAGDGLVEAQVPGRQQRRDPAVAARPKPGIPHRTQLVLAFSEDEARTWSEPVVIVEKKGSWLAYPYIYEATPGTLWLVAKQGPVRVTLQEADFVGEGTAFSYPPRQGNTR